MAAGGTAQFKPGYGYVESGQAVHETAVKIDLQEEHLEAQ